VSQDQLPGPRRARAVRRFILPALLVVALLWAGIQVAGEVGPALHNVVTADLGWLAVAAMFEVLSYLFLGSVLRLLAADKTLSYGDAVRVGLVSSGLGTVLPAAPIEGIVLAASELQTRGLERRRTFVALGLAQWYFARALFAVGALAALTVAAFAAIRTYAFGTSWPLMLTAAGVLAALFVFTGSLVRRLDLVAILARTAGRIPGARRRADHLAASCHAWSSEVRAVLGSRKNRVRLLGCAIAATVADATCFALALHAAGVHRGWVVLTLAYAVGMLAAFVPLLPAGLGAVEAAVPAFLASAHVPVPVALGGVLAYRALGTLMPAFVGTAALAQLRLRRRRRTQTPATRPADDAAIVDTERRAASVRRGWLPMKWLDRWLRWSRP
jgi:uncharacterized membrane protein YbhN (UPF0104 family)